MRCECLPFGAVPHSTRLFLDYLAANPKVAPFYPRTPSFQDWVIDESHLLRYDSGRRERMAEILEAQNRAYGCGERTIANLDRFRQGAAVVVTGQQVGLFGGPLFALLKALSAVRFASVADKVGVPVVPVFWLATEDHDLAEVNHATILSGEGDLRRVEVPTRGVEDAPVENVRFGEEILQAVEVAAGLLGPSEATDLLRESYRPGESLGSAFAHLFARLFRDWGVILLDASDPKLHAIAEPIYRAAAQAAPEIDAALLDRGRALHSAGYHEQVKVTPSSTLLFAVRNGARVPIHRGNGQFTVGKERIAPSDLLVQIAAAPEQFSANVLLRPVVQDYLLPTLAYTGGPAEVAYFAQAAVVYEKLLARITPVLPRFSATLVDPRATRLFAQYQIAFTELFQGEEHVRELLSSRNLPAELQQSFDQAGESLNSSLRQIKEQLQRLDPTLMGAEQRAASKMRYQLERLRSRAAKAELRRHAELTRQAHHLSTLLYPDKVLQEREIAGICFLARYGLGLLDMIYECMQTNCTDHKLLYI